MFRLVGVAEGGERLVVVGGRDAGYHRGFGVAAETVFEQPCEDGVSIGHDVLAARLPAVVDTAVARVGEGGDYATECREGFVDVAAFAEAGAGCFGGFGALATGQIDEADAG